MKTGVSLVANWQLTRAESDSAELIRRATYRGQACWAVGPDVCEHCVFWDDLGRKRTPRSRFERACRKYSQMKAGQTGQRVPAGTPACRFFQETKPSKEEKLTMDMREYGSKVFLKPDDVRNASLQETIATVEIGKF